MRFATVALALVGILGATPARAELVTLHFNEFTRVFPPAAGGLIDPADYIHSYLVFSSGNVALTPPSGRIEVIQSAFANHDHEANLASVAGNGTGIMRPAGEAGAFAMSTGGLFTVNSMELLMGFDGGEIGASSVVFRGYLAGALVDEITVPLAWHGTTGGVPPGQTIGWTTADLRSLSFIDRLEVGGVPTVVPPEGVSPAHVQNSAEFWVDNIAVHQAPEPATFLLIVLGGAGLLCTQRRA